jgi:hypothetical protein
LTNELSKNSFISLVARANFMGRNASWERDGQIEGMTKTYCFNSSLFILFETIDKIIFLRNVSFFLSQTSDFEKYELIVYFITKLIMKFLPSNTHISKTTKRHELYFIMVILEVSRARVILNYHGCVKKYFAC